VKERLSLILSATAVVIAVLGSTSVGQAASGAMSQKVRDASKAAGIGSSHAQPVRRGPRGPRGRRGRRGPRGFVGPQGPAGPQGEAGTAVAFARVDSNGAISLEKNITQANVSHPSTGIYCIGGLTRRPVNLVASPGTNGDALSEIVMLGGPGACAAMANLQAAVLLYDINGLLADNDFMMTIN
jgi:hypothetical protein